MERAILAGPFVGEMYWEIARFAGHAIWKKTVEQKNKAKLIVFTRPDRFDMYGTYADILVPLRIEGDGDKFMADCYRLKDFPHDSFVQLAKTFGKKYRKQYEVVEHILPPMKKKKWANKNFFPIKQMVLNDFRPRIDNINIVNQLPSDKPWVALAPRYRKDFRRNWPHWQEFYNMICDSKLMDKYYFILCGKYPDHIPDKQDRLFDINDMELTPDSSLIGLTIEILERAILTVGSQSGIPNISLLLGTEALEWGHQRTQHSITYNIFKTPVTFLDDMKYKIEAKTVFDKMCKILKKKEG